jgi:hypothetical protein
MTAPDAPSRPSARVTSCANLAAVYPPTTFVIDDLRQAINRILDETAASLGDRVELDGGLYWQVPAEQLHNMDPDSVALTAGDLDDDIQTMREYLGRSGPAPALWHELNHLIGILRVLEATMLP